MPIIPQTFLIHKKKDMLCRNSTTLSIGCNSKPQQQQHQLHTTITTTSTIRFRDTAQHAVYFNRLHQLALNDFISFAACICVHTGGEVAKKMISCKLT